MILLFGASLMAAKNKAKKELEDKPELQADISLINACECELEQEPSPAYNPKPTYTHTTSLPNPFYKYRKYH